MNLGLALNAVNRFFSKVSDDQQLKAHGLEKFRQSLLSDARDFYEQFPAQERSGARVLVEQGWNDLNLAKISEELGESREAIRLARRALATFEDLARKEPARLKHRQGIARALDSLGSHYWGDHQPEEAKKSLDQAVAAWERLMREYPSSPEFSHRHLVSMNRLGRLLSLVLHDQPGACEILGRSLAACEQMLRDGTQTAERLDDQAEATVLLGYSWALSDLAKARPFLDQALALRERLSADYPDQFEPSAKLLDTCVLIAGIFSNARISGQVPLLYDKVRQIGDRLANEHPDVREFAENRCLIETLYSIQLAQSGEHQRTTATAEQALARLPHSGLALFYVACCFSLASDAVAHFSPMPPDEKLRCVEQYQARAVELLHAAAETGLFLQPHQYTGLKSDDPDLAPIRGRQDFQRFVAGLKEPAATR